MGNKKDLYWEKATSSHIEISVFSDVFTPGKLPLLLAFLKSQMLLSKAVSSLKVQNPPASNILQTRRVEAVAQGGFSLYQWYLCSCPSV